MHSDQSDTRANDYVVAVDIVFNPVEITLDANNQTRIVELIIASNLTTADKSCLVCVAPSQAEEAVGPVGVVPGSADVAAAGVAHSGESGDTMKKVLLAGIALAFGTGVASAADLPVDHALFYGKAGGAWVGNDGFAVVDQTTRQAFVGDNSNTASGWMAGVGLEYAFTNNWTAKIEYDYIGLSGRTFVVPGTVIPALAGDTITSNHNVQMLKSRVVVIYHARLRAAVTFLQRVPTELR
jgi:OmpA family protein